MPTTEKTEPTKRDVDFQAVARVARVVELQEVRLTEISATRLAEDRPKGGLTPHIEHECSSLTRDDGRIDVTCTYQFTATAGDIQLARASLTYVLSYAFETDSPPALEQGDVDQFAFANGTYHSWPFVRQELFDLTARMGFPPFTLGTFKFNPKPPALKPAKKPGNAQAASTPDERPDKTRKK